MDTFLVGVVARAVVRGLGWWWALGSLEMGLQAFSKQRTQLGPGLALLVLGVWPSYARLLHAIRLTATRRLE